MSRLNWVDLLGADRGLQQRAWERRQAIKRASLVAPSIRELAAGARRSTQTVVGAIKKAERGPQSPLEWYLELPLFVSLDEKRQWMRFAASMGQVDIKRVYDPARVPVVRDWLVLESLW